jgi:hypothetical protein
MTQTNTSILTNGIRKFIRSLGLTNLQTYQLRQLSDEHDLVNALESIKYFYNSYVLLHEAHNPNTRGDPMSKVMEDTQKDMEEYLLRGTDERESMLKWMRNGAIYVLVVEPTLMLLAAVARDDTPQAITIVDEVINIVNTSIDYGDHDDAVVAREQIRHMLAKYRELHPSVAKAKQPGKPRKKRGRQEYSDPNDDPIERFNLSDTVEALDFN